MHCLAIKILVWFAVLALCMLGSFLFWEIFVTIIRVSHKAKNYRSIVRENSRLLKHISLKPSKIKDNGGYMCGRCGCEVWANQEVCPNCKVYFMVTGE